MSNVSARKQVLAPKVTFASLELPAQGACGALKGPGARLLFSAVLCAAESVLPTGKNMATPFFPTPSHEQFQPSVAVSTHIPISLHIVSIFIRTYYTRILSIY